jgi:putative tryptophan/tyrosine transport system substrate-binding protein
MPSTELGEMQRRDFITLLVSTVLTWSVAARAQQPGKVWRIGSLYPASSGQSENLKAFMQGLKDLGYINGKNVQFERRVADGDLDRLPALAVELVRTNVDLILAESSFAVEAARAATKTIPIVMTGVGNPVGSGFVKSISQPGGNITGLSNDSIEVSSNYLEYLRAAVPDLMRVGVLFDPKHPNHPTVLKQIQTAAQAIGASIFTIELRSVSDIDAALRLIQQERLDALIVPPDPTFSIIYRQIAEFALSNRLPTMFGQRRGVEAGGLMGYEPNLTDMYKRAAALADKILKGAKPADLPVEFPTRFQFIINLKTAKALGLTVPPALLTSADDLIE